MVQEKEKDEQYDAEAYGFLLEALERTRRELRREGHVSGGELLEGIQLLATERFGPMAALVFREWGVSHGGDFGNMVYELVDKGVLFRREEDSIDDFLGGKPYELIFEEEYFTPKEG